MSSACVPQFRAIRKAFEASLLNPAGLESHEPMLRQCAEHFVAALAKHAHSGQPVDMARAFDAVTMDGVGFAAFGIDLHCMDALISADTTADKDTSGWLSKPGTPEFGRGLGRALHMTRYFFNPAVSTKWKLPVRGLPLMLGSCLAFRLALRISTRDSPRIPPQGHSLVVLRPGSCCSL